MYGEDCYSYSTTEAQGGSSEFLGVPISLSKATATTAARDADTSAYGSAKAKSGLAKGDSQAIALNDAVVGRAGKVLIAKNTGAASTSTEGKVLPILGKPLVEVDGSASAGGAYAEGSGEVQGRYSADAINFSTTTKSAALEDEETGDQLAANFVVAKGKAAGPVDTSTYSKSGTDSSSAVVESSAGCELSDLTGCKVKEVSMTFASGNSNVH